MTPDRITPPVLLACAATEHDGAPGVMIWANGRLRAILDMETHIEAEAWVKAAHALWKDRWDGGVDAGSVPVDGEPACTKTETITVDIRDDLHARLSALAEDHGITAEMCAEILMYAALADLYREIDAASEDPDGGAAGP